MIEPVWLVVGAVQFSAGVVVAANTCCRRRERERIDNASIRVRELKDQKSPSGRGENEKSGEGNYLWVSGNMGANKFIVVFIVWMKLPFKNTIDRSEEGRAKKARAYKRVNARTHAPRCRHAIAAARWVHWNF